MQAPAFARAGAVLRAFAQKMENAGNARSLQKISSVYAGAHAHYIDATAARLKNGARTCGEELDMKRMSGLIGTAVIADGRRAGRVSGVVLEDGRHIAGVLVEGALGGSRMVSLGQISVIGDVSLQCAGKGARMGGCEPFVPGRALSTGGMRLGRVSDLIIDERSGRVEAIEISRGYIDDLMGKRLVCDEFALAPQTGDAVVSDSFWEKASARRAVDGEGGRI